LDRIEVASVSSAERWRSVARRAAAAPSVTRYAKDSTKGSLKWLASHPFLFFGLPQKENQHEQQNLLQTHRCGGEHHHERARL